MYGSDDLFLPNASREVGRTAADVLVMMNDESMYCSSKPSLDSAWM